MTLTMFNCARYQWTLQRVSNVSLNKDGFRQMLIDRHARKHLTDSRSKRERNGESYRAASIPAFLSAQFPFTEQEKTKRNQKRGKLD